MADDGPPPGQTQAASVPTAPASDGVREWEQPWSISEMRQGANNWSLSGDARLLLYLQDFSQKMISKVHQIEKEVDGLMNESKLTSVRLNNVFNDFIMLANTQFVENRVYDEDVSQDGAGKANDQQEEKEKTREEREAELIPRVKEALSLGINVIDQSFEQLDSHVADSDSEDDDTAYRVDPILEAKDPYLARSLPLMIGTPKFMDDDAVGLKDEESGAEESDEGSISESDEEEEGKKKEEEEEEEEDEETTESESESDTEKPRKEMPKRTIATSDSEEDSSEGDLFGENEKSEEEEEEEEEEVEEEEKKTPKPAGPGGFAEELARKLGAPVPKVTEESEEEGEEEIIPKEEKKPRKKKDSESSRSGKKDKKKKKSKQEKEDEPFPVEEENDAFPSRGGLFSSGKGLFDDDEDDEGDLFNDIMEDKPARKKSVKKEEDDDGDEEEDEEPEEKPKRKRTTSGKKIPKGAVSIFGDAGESIMGGKSKQEDQEKTKPSGGGGGGLFDDEDDDLFSAPPPTKSEPAKKEKKDQSKQSAPASLFDEDEDDDEGDLFSGGREKEEPEVPKEEPKKKKAPEKKLPAGAVSMFGGAPNPLAAAIKKRKPDSDEENQEGWSDEDKPRTASMKSNQSNTSVNSITRAVQKPNKPSPSPSSNSLFDDDADDALFSAPPKPNAQSQPKKKSLFDDEDDGLFDANKTAPVKTDQKKVAAKPKSGGLFEDDENEDDLFGVPAKPKDSGMKKPTGGVSLFGGVDVLGVGSKEKPVETAPPEKKAEPVKPKAPVSNKLSLFDDEEEEEDLFGGGATAASQLEAPTATQGKPVPKSKDLFQDEDILFGGDQGESPAIDIFSTTPTTKTNKTTDGPLEISGATTTESSDMKPQEPSEEPKPRKPVGGVSMFGGLDPMAALNKRKGGKETIAEEKPVEVPKKQDQPAVVPSKPEKTATVPSKPEKPRAAKAKDSLFDDDEDEEDLFAPPKPASKPIPSKPPPKDELFGSPKSDDDLFGSSPKPPVNQAIEEEKREEPVKPKKPPGAVSMFGGVDPFAAMKKKSPSVEEKVDKEQPSKESPPKDDLFGSPKSDDDLFGSSPKTPVNQASGEEKREEPVKPKKPPGAVPMFGGADPFAAMKKKSPSIEEREDSVPKSPDKDEIRETEKPVSKVGKLKMNIGINPAALLPGAAPPIKEPETVAIDFDQPAEAKTLHSANKDRAKIQAKRRPPSRRGRQPSATSTSPTLPSLPNGLPEVHVEPSAHGDGPRSPELPPLDNDRVPTERNDLFGNDDLFGDTASSARPSARKTAENASNDVLNMDTEDLFSPRKDKGKPAMSDDDLFGASKTESKSKSRHAVLTNDNDDDIFSSSSVKTSKSSKSAMMNGDDNVSSKTEVISEKKKPTVDDDEDIFSTKKTKKATDFEKLFDKDADEGKVSASQTKGGKSIPEEDDIFADSSVGKAKDAKVKKEEDSNTKETGPANKTQQEDEDDIFASASKSTKKTRVRPKTKDEDLFKDETDIFADVPASKPKEKKKKKAEKTEKKGIFKDDVDDIFADVSTPKTKKEKKKTDSSKAKSKADDIFDDPLN